jgi:hypothetical protein
MGFVISVVFKKGAEAKGYGFTSPNTDLKCKVWSKRQLSYNIEDPVLCTFIVGCQRLTEINSLVWKKVLRSDFSAYLLDLRTIIV